MVLIKVRTSIKTDNPRFFKLGVRSSRNFYKLFHGYRFRDFQRCVLRVNQNTLKFPG